MPSAGSKGKWARDTYKSPVRSLSYVIRLQKEYSNDSRNSGGNKPGQSKR